MHHGRGVELLPGEDMQRARREHLLANGLSVSTCKELVFYGFFFATKDGPCRREDAAVVEQASTWQATPVTER